MKCICGYENTHGMNVEGRWQMNLIGDEEFIHIQGANLEIPEQNYRKVALYACPKCDTVKMEKD